MDGRTFFQTRRDTGVSSWKCIHLDMHLGINVQHRTLSVQRRILRDGRSNSPQRWFAYPLGQREWIKVGGSVADIGCLNYPCGPSPVEGEAKHAPADRFTRLAS